MKLHLFAALIGCVISVGAMGQSTEASDKAPIVLNQSAFVLGEASSKVAPASPSTSTANTPAATETDTGPGPLIATRAADGSMTVTHEGDPVPVKEAQ